MTAPVTFAEDRSIAVPPGTTIRTAYVSVWDVRLACRDRMAIGDIKSAFEKRLQLGDHQPWPCPRGEWEGDKFVIFDGRHEWLASVALGLEFILVAWVDEASARA